jgi:hypothetical protein
MLRRLLGAKHRLQSMVVFVPEAVNAVFLTVIMVPPAADNMSAPLL